jgi:hypothetical protein
MANLEVGNDNGIFWCQRKSLLTQSGSDSSLNSDGAVEADTLGATGLLANLPCAKRNGNLIRPELCSFRKCHFFSSAVQ